MTTTNPQQPYKRLVCCFCVPLSVSVGFIGLMTIGAGIFELMHGLSDGNATATRAVSCVSFAVYTFLGAFALLAAARKTLSLATTLSKMWWAFTLLSCILAGVQLILVFTLKDGVSKYVCNDEHLVHEQDLCQSVAPTAAAITLGIYVVVLCIFGWVISQFKWEVGHDEALAAGGNSIDLSVKV